jgi:hypothetical protein
MASTAPDFDYLYAAWGKNAERLAADIGQPAVTVRQWRNRGNVPPEHWAKIIESAALRGVVLTVDDFGPMPPEVLAVEKAIAAERRAAA